MPIDDWLRDPPFRSAHHRVVAAPPDVVSAALSRADFTRPALIRLLLAARAVPSLLLWRVPRIDRLPGVPIWCVGPLPFTLLEDTPPRELVLGLQGAFWQLDGGLTPAPPEGYRQPCPPGLARVVWNFRVGAAGAGSRVETETRVTCGDEASRRRFARYWRLIAPFSGVIRHAMLREVERAARGAPQPSVLAIDSPDRAAPTRRPPAQD
jgi:hypothetical protein